MAVSPTDCYVHSDLLIGTSNSWILALNLLTPWSRVLLEKLTVCQLVKKFPTFYETRRFITVFTSALHLSLSRVSSIQSITPHPISWTSILILPSHLRLCLPSGLFPSGFPTKTLYTPLLSPIRATCPAYLILLDFITRTILGEAWYWTTNEIWTLFQHLPSFFLFFSSFWSSHYSPFLFSASSFQPSFLLYLPFILYYF